MKNDQSDDKLINSESKNIISEYRTFEEFKEISDEQILEIDGFLKSYAELIYNCFSSEPESESGKVVEMNKKENNLKAA